MTYKGIVRGKVIELEDQLGLPEGTEVEVVVKEPKGKDRVNLKELTNSDGFRNAIEEVLVERIKPECLAERQR